MANPSEKVKDTFRPRNIGFDGTMPFNSKPATDDFHVDRERLGQHQEWDPEAPNEWGGRGDSVRTPNHIMHNVRRSVGDIKFRSSSCNCPQDCAPNEREKRAGGHLCDEHSHQHGHHPIDHKGRHE